MRSRDFMVLSVLACLRSFTTAPFSSHTWHFAACKHPVMVKQSKFC